MYVKLGPICAWPSSLSALSVQQKLPHFMKEKFPNVRSIMDRVEFKVAVSSSLNLHKMLYSD